MASDIYPDMKDGWPYIPPPYIETYDLHALNQLHAMAMRKAAAYRSWASRSSLFYTPRNAREGGWWARRWLRDAKEYRKEIERRRKA